MRQEDNMNTTAIKKIKINEKTLVYISSIALIILSIYYYLERVTFSDSGAYLAHILADDGFAISMNSRFVGAISQLLPILAFKLHLSLKSILILYSVNYTLIAVLPAIISMHWFKETRTAWSILFFYTLMAGQLFYYPVTEYQQGLCLFLFYIGLYEYSKRNTTSKVRLLIASILLIPTIIFSHPLAVLVFFTWIALSLFDKDEFKKSIIIPIILAATSFVIKHMYFSIQYESERSDFKKIFQNFTFSDLFQRQGNSFIQYLIQDYFLLIILLIITLYFVTKLKKGIVGFLISLALVAWWVLITTAYKNDRFSHYSEHLYQAIPFIIAWTFCKYSIPNINKSVSVIIISVIMLISLIKVNNGSFANTERIEWFEKCFTEMDKMKCSKAVYSYSSLPDQKECYAIWTIPYESVIISSVKDKRNCKYIYPVQQLDNLKFAELITPRIDDFYDTKKLSKEYFDIPTWTFCIPEKQ